ncbi:MAG TPA: tripartite tricarboxylate transporter substrate-binding protein, partial [Burkholderiales bacterium]|nr:tripartite tricarboxylate transporter substrate-binding protein [Burkholderiales bacterium]
MTTRSLYVGVALIAVVAALTSGDLAAQAYPTKIVRVVNPNQPGGNSDIIFRLLSPKMGEVLGQQVVIDYRAGAGGNIGADIVAKSAPDGYTTLIAAASFLINPSLIRNLPFDAVRDFTPLGLIVDIPAALVIHPSLPVKNVQELIALAKKRPGEVFFSSSGPGAVGHLSGELLNALAGIKLVHVPYKGAGPAVVDLVAGHVQL